MAKKKTQKIVVVMPAYNAARTVKDTLKEIPPKYKKHVILVDDQSKDNTVAVSKKLGIKVFAHPNNLGYGGNQKTCYWEALKLDPDVVVMLHPDYQYDGTMMPYLVQPILDGKYDFMFGSRIATKKGALKGGMPLHKYLLNRIICFIQNILLGVNFSEHFSGYRAFSKKFLLTIPFQRFSNDFGFDQEMTISAISHNMRIGEIPIPTRYHEKQSSIQFFKGIKFIIDGFLTIARYLMHQAGIVKDNRFAPRKTIKENKKKQKNKNILSLIFLALLIFFLKSRIFLNLWLGIFVFVQSVLLFLLTDRFKIFGFIKKAVSLSVIVLVALFVIGTGIYKDTFYVSNFERNQLWVRRELYRRDLGIVGRSNLGNMTIEKTKFFHDKLIRKITQPFDFYQYFSIDPESFYYLIFLPFFVLGFLFLLSENVWVVLLYLGLAILGTVFTKPHFTYWLFMPLINLGILFGLINLKRVFEKRGR